MYNKIFNNAGKTLIVIATIKKALITMSQKKLGILIAKNSKGLTTGIITDGQLRRATQKLTDISNHIVKKIMTKNPITVHKDMLISESLSDPYFKKLNYVNVVTLKSTPENIFFYEKNNFKKTNEVYGRIYLKLFLNK